MLPAIFALQVFPRTPQERPKTSPCKTPPPRAPPGPPMSAPRSSQSIPRGPQDLPKTPQERTRTAHQHSKTLPRQPKSTSGAPQDPRTRPRPPKDCPKSFSRHPGHNIFGERPVIPSQRNGPPRAEKTAPRASRGTRVITYLGNALGASDGVIHSRISLE